MSELVTCKDLTKRFGNHTALDHLNLSLDSGKIISGARYRCCTAR